MYYISEKQGDNLVVTESDSGQSMLMTYQELRHFLIYNKVYGVEFNKVTSIGMPWDVYDTFVYALPNKNSTKYALMTGVEVVMDDNGFVKRISPTASKNFIIDLRGKAKRLEHDCFVANNFNSTIVLLVDDSLASFSEKSFTKFKVNKLTIRVDVSAVESDALLSNWILMDSRYSWNDAVHIVGDGDKLKVADAYAYLTELHKCYLYENPKPGWVEKFCDKVRPKCLVAIPTAINPKGQLRDQGRINLLTDAVSSDEFFLQYLYAVKDSVTELNSFVSDMKYLSGAASDWYELAWRVAIGYDDKILQRELKKHVIDILEVL